MNIVWFFPAIPVQLPYLCVMGAAPGQAPCSKIPGQPLFSFFFVFFVELFIPSPPFRLLSAHLICCLSESKPTLLSLRPVSPPSSIQFLAFISLTPLLSPTVSYRARLYHNQHPGISFFFWCLFSVDHWYFILFHHESGRLRGSRAPELNLLTDLAEKIKGRRSVFNFHTHTHSV